MERKSLREWKEKRAEEIEIQKKVFEALGMGDEVRKWIAAVRIQRKVRRVWAKRDARRRLWAVGVFQKWARGWGVRKEVWWHRALGKMRARRRELARSVVLSPCLSFFVCSVRAGEVLNEPRLECFRIWGLRKV